MSTIKKFLSKNGSLACMGSLISIGLGLILGLILLFCFNAPYAIDGFGRIMTTAFASGNDFAKMLYYAAPLMMVGLSVGFAFKTGLFNIGAPGQFTIGTFCGLVMTIQFQMPWYVGIIAAAIGGAVWGFFPGLFKAIFNVNEVIAAIMFNWMGLFLVNLCISNMPKMVENAWGGVSKEKTPLLSVANPNGKIPDGGMYEMFLSEYATIAIFISIAIAIILYIVMNKTTFGYELKACGLSKDAGIYAGINAKRNIILSMVIAGALAGIGGAMNYFTGSNQYAMIKELSGIGFNGIPVALLGASNPIGIIFSALFMGFIQVGGEALQPDFAEETINIIIAAIIYFSAFSLLVQQMLKKVFKADEGNVNAEPAVINKEESKDDKTVIEVNNKEVTK